MSTYDLILKEGIAEGIEKGIEKGIAKGIEKEKINTIVKGYKKGLSLEILSSLTGFSINEITLIIESQK